MRCSRSPCTNKTTALAKAKEKEKKILFLFEVLVSSFHFCFSLSAWYILTYTQHSNSRRFHFFIYISFLLQFTVSSWCNFFFLFFFCNFSFGARNKLTRLHYRHRPIEYTLNYYWLLHVSMMWNTRMVHNQMNIATKIVYDDVPISSDK